jgi:hypothetical protein
MASLRLVDPLAETSPTKVDQDNRLGLGLEEPKRAPTATATATTTRRNERERDPALNLSPWPRQRSHGLHHSHPSRPSALVRALTATKHFFFAEDKTLQEGYIPNYRCASSPHSIPFVQPLLVRYLPILSGLIVPFAILLESGSPLYPPHPNSYRYLSVPGLTSHWYIRTDGYVTVETQENPPILYAAMSISIALAVIANICEYKLRTHPNPGLSVPIFVTYNCGYIRLDYSLLRATNLWHDSSSDRLPFRS